MPDEKKKIDFTPEARRDADFVEATQPLTFSLDDARQQINEIDGIPPCFSFLKDGNVVQREDEKNITVTENRIELVIDFSALQRTIESEWEILRDKKNGSRNKTNSGSYGEKSLKVVDTTANIFKLMSQIARKLGKVGKKYLEEEASTDAEDASAGEGGGDAVEEEKERDQATDAIKGAEQVIAVINGLSVIIKKAAPWALPVAITFDAMVLVLMEIGKSIKVDQRAIELFDRLGILLSCLDDVAVYVVVKDGSITERGDKIVYRIMNVIDQSFAKIKKIHKERHDAGFGRRVKRLLTSNGHLKILSFLDSEISKILLETSALTSIKIHERQKSLDKKVDGLDQKVDDIRKDMQMERIIVDDESSERLSSQTNQSIQEGVQIDSVLTAAIQLNMIFLTLAYKFFHVEENDRDAFCKGMTGNELSDYLKQEREILKFLPEHETLFDASLESLGDDVILYDIDRSNDCTFGIFISTATKRITIVFRPLIVAPNVEKQSEWKISTFGILFEEIDLSKFNYVGGEIGKVYLHRGYYKCALRKSRQIKRKLYKLKYKDLGKFSKLKYEDFSLYVSGHSFGAAIANIVSFLIVMNGNNNKKTLTLSTFGSPRVGDFGWREINRDLGEERRLVHLRVSSDPSFGEVRAAVFFELKGKGTVLEFCILLFCSD